MKIGATLTLLLFMSIPYLAESQNAPEGLGLLKIGSTLDELLINLNIKRALVLTKDYDRPSVKKILKSGAISQYSISISGIPDSEIGSYYLLKSDTLIKNFAWSTDNYYSRTLYKSIKSELYSLRNYKVGSLDFDNLDLLFYDGKLSLINYSAPGIGDNSVQELMRKKFTPTKYYKNYDTVACKYNLTGVESKKIEHRFFSEWKGLFTRAEYKSNFLLNSECQFYLPDDYFRIYSNDFFNIISSQKELDRKNSNQAKDEALKNTLESL